MRTTLLILVSLILVGCQYDPHASLYTASEPTNSDIVGIYTLDRLDLPQKLNTTNREISVEIRADGTFTATNIPPWKMEEPDTNFFASLLSGTGHWEKSILGGNEKEKFWGVYFRTTDDRFHPAFFTGNKPPYGLIFTLGDPDSGYGVVLKRKP